MNELEYNDEEDSFDPINKLFRHLTIKYMNFMLPDQVGVIIESNIPEFDGRYVLFHDGTIIRIIEAPDGDYEEFTTVSYGPLN